MRLVLTGVLVTVACSVALAGGAPVPESGLVIVPWDRQYTQPVDPEARANYPERPSGSYGYVLSSHGIAYGPVGAGSLESPMGTTVTDLARGRHYVYLRYNGGGIWAKLAAAIWAKLAGEQEFRRFDPRSCDARITVSPAKYSTAAAYEAYLGYVDGREVEVIVHGDPDGVLNAYYDGLIIRSEEQERVRMPRVKAELRAELSDAEQYTALTRTALYGPLREDTVFDGKRAQLVEVERTTDCRSRADVGGCE